MDLYKIVVTVVILMVTYISYVLIFGVPVILKRKPKRTVMLQMYNGAFRTVPAHGSTSGVWRANWMESANYVDNTCWCVLLPKGKVLSDGMVRGWIPADGWDGTEFK